MGQTTEAGAGYWLTEAMFALHMLKGHIERGTPPDTAAFKSLPSHVLRHVADLLDEGAKPQTAKAA